LYNLNQMDRELRYQINSNKQKQTRSIDNNFRILIITHSKKILRPIFKVINIKAYITWFNPLCHNNNK